MFGSCAVANKNPIIAVAENGRKFIVVNKSKSLVRKVQVDGCVVLPGPQLRCDYLFEVGDPYDSAIYVELKGADVSHAYSQLVATLNRFRARHVNVPKQCHVVASRVPRMGGAIQQLKIRMLKDHGAVFSVHTSVKKVIV